MDEHQTTKERFLLEVIWRLAGSYGFLPPSPISDVGIIIPKSNHDDVAVGDVVICLTSPFSGVHPWTVAVVADIDRSQDLWWLRDIGTGKVISMSNERFYKLVGIKPQG